MDYKNYYDENVSITASNYKFNAHKISVKISVKNCIDIFMGIVLNLYITFGRIAIFTILILLIHEH